MVRKILFSSILLFFLFHPFIISAQSDADIELFDIEKNEITQTTPTNPKIQLEAEKIMKEIDNIVKKFNPIPDKGYLVRIPLEPSVPLKNRWVDALIDEVVLIIPDKEDPHLLLFDDENQPYFFTFEAKIDTLLDAIDLSL